MSNRNWRAAGAVAAAILALTAAFGAGYLWRGEISRAPIIIQQN